VICRNGSGATNGVKMYIKSTLLMCGACAMSITAYAGEQFNIKPGKWKSDVTIEMTMVTSGMTIEQPPRTTSHEYCVTAEEASFTPEDFAKKMNETPEMAEADCDVTDIVADHPRLSYTLRCNMDGTAMTMKNDFTVGADGLSGTGNGNMSFSKDSMSVKAKTKMVQTFVGGC